jgi:hypothetical protein
MGGGKKADEGGDDNGEHTTSTRFRFRDRMRQYAGCLAATGHACTASVPFAIDAQCAGRAADEMPCLSGLLHQEQTHTLCGVGIRDE